MISISLLLILITKTKIWVPMIMFKIWFMNINYIAIDVDGREDDDVDANYSVQDMIYGNHLSNI